MRALVLVSILTLTSCSMMKSLRREITIDSTPSEAEVSYLASSGEFRVIGKTPLTIEDSVVKEWQDSKQDYAIVRVAKSGYVMENLFIDLNGRYKLSFSAQLKALDVWNNKETENSSNAANKVALKVQHINHQIFTKSFQEALTNTENLIEQFPKAHVFYDMKGSILLLMGRKNEALASYQKSLSLNPDNNEAKKMLQRVNGER